MAEQSISDDSYIILGKINAHHGIKGWLKVYSYTDPKQNLLSYKKVLLLRPSVNSQSIVNISENIWKELCIDDGRLQGKGIVAHFSGYDNRESAEELLGSTIAIERTALKTLADNEYYWVELVGLEVFNQEGINLGRIEKIMPTAANDVLIVKNNNYHQESNAAIQKEYLIPYIMGTFITSIDLQVGRMQVDWDVDF